MKRTWLGLLCSLLLATSACGSDDDIDSDTEARWAYLGFDAAIDRAINLGFDGFNAANSANIPEQVGDGDVSGTMTVNGQVDQGASANKGMRLDIDVLDYADGPVDDTHPDSDAVIDATYDTPLDIPLDVDISLRNIPDGTFTGTMVGDLIVSGEDLNATATFNIAMSGDIEAVGGGDMIVRTPGTLVITGTVTSGDGEFIVDVTK